MDLASRINGYVAEAPVVLFSKSYCTFCKKVKQLLSEQAPELSVVYVELDRMPDGVAMQVELSVMTELETVPQVFINRKFIGGCDSMLALHKSGDLARLLQANEL